MKAIAVEAHPEVEKEKIKLPSWMAWAGATTAGYALGMTLSTGPLGSLVRPLSPFLGGILNVLIFGAVNGAAIGACQVAVLPRGLVPIHRWILATLAGSAVGFGVAAVVSEALSNSMDPARNVVLGFAGVAVIAGGTIGLAFGLGQGLALGGRWAGRRGWIWASAAGTLLGTLASTALLGLLEWPVFAAAPGTAVGVILGIFAGIFQGLVFRAQRRQTKG